MTSTVARTAVEVIYTHFPDYCTAVFDAFLGSETYDTAFHWDPGGIESPIEIGEAGAVHHYFRVRKLRSFSWQCGAIQFAWSGQALAFIFLSKVPIPSTWIDARIARLTGKKFTFRTHGWLRLERGLCAYISISFYRPADMLFTHGSRAPDLGELHGYECEKTAVVYYFLHFDAKVAAQSSVAPVNVCDVWREPYFICVEPLIESAQRDLAVDALALLGEEAQEMVIVGGGPMRSALVTMATSAGGSVQFLGFVNGESRLAVLVSGVSAVVSPSKVGLIGGACADLRRTRNH